MTSTIGKEKLNILEDFVTEYRAQRRLLGRNALVALVIAFACCGLPE